ncbi:MAG: YitT family protein [Bacteroidia bacterium]
MSLEKNESVDWSAVFNPKNLILTTLGVLMAVLALQGFMVPNHFLDGGVTGISILIHELFHIRLNILIIVINIPFIYFGYKRIGKTFTVQTVLAVLLLALGLSFKIFDSVTDNKLLIAVFGGFLIGAGMGLCIRGGGVIDGIEILAVFTTKKIGFTTTEVILYTNSILFLIVAFTFQGGIKGEGLETAMYSIITYFTAMRALDYIVDGIEEYTALHCISSMSDDIKSLIVNDFNKGITVQKGERGYLPGSFDVKTDCDIIITIVTRLELLALQQAITKLDPKAFMYVHTIREAKGGVLSRRKHH